MANRFSVEAVFKAVDKMTAPITRMQNRVNKFTRKIRIGFDKLNRGVNSFVTGVGRAARSAVKFSVIGIGAVTTAIGLLVREFSKVENAEAAFTPLLGGAKRAKEMVQALNDTAATTPFQFENLSKAARQLLPVMDGDIQKTIKMIRMLGDTAGGNSLKLDSITRGFTKAMLKGKVDMESLNMIAEAGVPIFKDLAAVLGMKTGERFFKMISAGKVTTEHLTKAFQKMTNKGGIFFRGMEIASKTTTGLFSTLMDNISLTAAELGSVLAPTIKDLIKSATEVAKGVREWVKANRDVIETKFLAFVKDIKTAIKGFIKILDDLDNKNSILKRLGEAIISISNAFKWMFKNARSILTITSWVVGLIAALKVLSLILGIIALPFGAVALGVAAVIAVVSSLVIWIDDIVDAFNNMNPVIRALLAPLDAVVRAIKFIKDSFVGGFGSATSKFMASFGVDVGENDNNKQPIETPHIVSPQERVARSIEEQNTTNSTEVTLRAEGVNAEVTKGKLGGGISLIQSGAF